MRDEIQGLTSEVRAAKQEVADWKGRHEGVTSENGELMEELDKNSREVSGWSCRNFGGPFRCGEIIVGGSEPRKDAGTPISANIFCPTSLGGVFDNVKPSTNLVTDDQPICRYGSSAMLV